ncbi:hypothetical protein Gotur_011518 [Gossypium turneri]
MKLKLQLGCLVEKKEQALESLSRKEGIDHWRLIGGCKWWRLECAVNYKGSQSNFEVFLLEFIALNFLRINYIVSGVAPP